MRQQPCTAGQGRTVSSNFRSGSTSGCGRRSGVAGGGGSGGSSGGYNVMVVGMGCWAVAVVKINKVVKLVKVAKICKIYKMKKSSKLKS